MWYLITLLEDMKNIGHKCFFNTKFYFDGSAHRYIARIVAKGYAQEFGVDYEEAALERMEIVRPIFAIRAQLKWHFYHLDVKSAFLNGEIAEDVFVEQSEGFVIERKEHCVYKLNKALYGLKQALEHGSAK